MAGLPVTEFAPAKINLCLHVTGRRPDGYHVLDSLVVFAGAGDEITVAPGADLSLAITGPEASALAAEGGDNLVLRAARAMGVTAAALSLTKVLPVASGIGGGSADAAATLRALVRFSGQDLPAPSEILKLGADVPVCLAGLPVRMRGVGEVLSPLPSLPRLWCVLANPRVPVPTPAVFAALAQRQNAGLPAELPPSAFREARSVCDWLRQATRNDLADPALQVAPVLAAVQEALSALDGCLLARMSGSGGTHFALFETEVAAIAAEARLRRSQPGWWVAGAPIL